MNRLIRSLLINSKNYTFSKTIFNVNSKNYYSNQAKNVLFVNKLNNEINYKRSLLFLNKSYSTTAIEQNSNRDFASEDRFDRRDNFASRHDGGGFGGRRDGFPSNRGGFGNRDGFQRRNRIEDEDNGEIVDDSLSFSPKAHSEVHKYESKDASFSNFNIPKSLLDRLDELGYKKPFPIQEKTLEHTLAGKDLVGRAVTGSGKTLAFAIPIICKVLNSQNRKERFPKCLVLSPTRELCIQLQKSIQELEPSLKCVAIYGGSDLMSQVRQLESRADIVCATPGRLRDLETRRNFVKDYLELVCLDEADELLTPNFVEQIDNVLDTGKPKQMLMFSATLDENVRELIHKYMNKPVKVDLTEGQQVRLPENVKHHGVRVPEYVYGDMVKHLIEKFNSKRCIVFTNSKIMAGRLGEQLSFSTKKRVAELHSDHSQTKRERVFQQFRNGSLDVLVATDVAARGLDIPEIDMVIQAGTPPNGAPYYIHRSGRTGRAGRPGISVLLHSGHPKERNTLRDVEMLIKLESIPVPEEIAKKISESPRFGDRGSFGQSRSFDRFGSGSRSFDRFGSGGRSFDRFGSGDRSFDRSGSEGHSFNRFNDRGGFGSDNRSFNRFNNKESGSDDRPRFGRFQRDDNEGSRFDSRGFSRPPGNSFGRPERPGNEDI